ncbi:MAG: hypothetical protein LBN74_05215 [Prevotella sp.]|jgi:hypothetical protein|nr:hypothetical protein [Prevotella sp.]
MNKTCIFSLIIFLLFSTSITAQKIKTKKDIISIDDMEAARIEKRENKKSKEKSIVFYSLNNSDSIEFRHYTLAPQEIYYGIHTSLSQDTADIKLEMLSFTFNEEKAITELIVKQYKFIDKEGLQSNNIKEYIANQKEKEIPKALAKIAENKVLEEKVNEMKLAVSKTDEITQAGKRIGKIVNALTRFRPQDKDPIIILDENNREIARITSVDTWNKTIVKTYDNEEFTCKPRADFSLDGFRYDYLTSVVRELAKGEYLPGQNNSFDVQQKIKLQKESIAKSVFKSKTIVYGELILKNYAPQFGFFKCQFRQTEEGNVNEFKNTPMINEDNYKGFEITYFDEPRNNDENGLDKIDFTSGRIIPIKDCDIFIISAVYDEQGNMTRVEEGYGPVEFSARKYDGQVSLIPQKYNKFSLILTPRNYVTLYRSLDVYILSINDGKKTAIGKDVFTKNDLLDFAKNYPKMIQKIEEENNYLNGEEGLKQFARDFDKAVIDSLH